MEGVRGEPSACDTARTIRREHWPQGNLRFHWVEEILGVGLVPERNNEFTF